MSGTLQNLPGPSILANYNLPTAIAAQTLGRPLSGGAANMPVGIIDPGTIYGERLNQVDLISDSVGEVRRPLTSPFSWLAVGVFALLAGIAFVTTLNGFLGHSSDALLAPPAEPINVNQLLIRPFLFDVGLAAFLVLPLITARAFTTDRGGDEGSVLGIFAGTLVLYLFMLLASMLLVAVLFFYGAPEWGSIVSGYLGLMLTGAAFMSVGLFISSLATRAVPAGIATGALSLVLLAATWLARSGAPAAQPVFRYFSIGNVLDDFTKGIIDSGHVASCLIVIALSLFLTRRAVESRRSVEPA